MNKGNLFLYSFLSFLGSAVLSFIITMIMRDRITLLSNILAALFWIMLLIGVAFCIMLAKRTKPKNKTFPRTLLFFKGKHLKIIDTVMILSIAITVILSKCYINYAPLWSFVVFADIFSIELHFLFSIK